MSETELAEAAARGDTEAVERLLAAGADPGGAAGADTPLINAVAGGNEDVLRLLLDGGAAVDGAGLGGNTPLMHAAAAGRLAIVRLLLARGADPGHRNRWDQSATDWAQWAANGEEIVAELRHAVAE